MVNPPGVDYLLSKTQFKHQELKIVSPANNEKKIYHNCVASYNHINYF